MEKVKILYLYAEVMGYTVATIKELVKFGAEVKVISWNIDKINSDENHADRKTYFRKSDFSEKELLKFALNFSPDITVVSGWQDKTYLFIAKQLRKKDLKVVSCFDDQWFNSYKQVLAYLLGKINFFKLFFSHAWVSGHYQFEYARKIGFKKNEIIFDLLSADQDVFKGTLNNKEKKFLFVGRLVEEKGLNLLLEAWSRVQLLYPDWKLELIGDGPLENQINNKNVIHKSFTKSEELTLVMSKAICLILPSNFEPWGVVVHEAAACGLVLILSDKVGSAPTFLIDKFNGYLFKDGNSRDLEKSMLKIIHASDNELAKMRDISISMSKRITPNTSAMNLLSLID